MFDDQNPPEVGHNSSQDLIKYIERAERLKSEIDELTEDLKSIKAEAKSAGYDMRTFNDMLKLRALDANVRKEREELRDTYALALKLFA